MTDQITALRTEYRELSRGTFADQRWSVATLERKLAPMREAYAQRVAAEAAKEAAAAERKAQREARIAARGSWDQFSERAFNRELEGDEAQLAYVAYYARGNMDNAQDTLAEFSAAVLKDPTYALSWSGASFEAAAKLAVGKVVREYVEAGATLSDLQSKAMTEALRGARSPARSTSPTSNLMETSMTAAWAALLDRMGDA